MTREQLFASAEYKQNEYRLARSVWCKQHLEGELRRAKDADVRRMFELELAAAEGEFRGYHFRDDELYNECLEAERRRRRT